MADLLNFAILGAGHIATKMAATLNFLRGELCPYAIASRDYARAETLRAQFSFEKAYGSYSDLLSDPKVNVVYIATPNTLHFNQAMACLKAGKNVIVEKPFTMTRCDAEILFAEAASRNLFITEAVWTRFQPIVPMVRQIIASGEIGTPRFLQATFSLAISHKERIIDPRLGGGALVDLGIYPIHFLDLFFGLDYKRLSSHATLSKEGVDDQSTITIEYPDGRMASLSTSMTAAYGTSSRIAGTIGAIEMNQLTKCESLTIRKVPSNEERIIDCPFLFNGYEYEILSTIKAINSGALQCPEIPHKTTLKVITLMEELRSSWGYGQPQN